MPGAIEELSGIDLSEVREEVGSRAFERGRGYARAQRVAAIDWDPSDLTLKGTVVGTSPYVTIAYFAEVDGGLEFDAGECSCPVGYDCKHVAALVIAVVEGHAGVPDAGGASRPRQVATGAPSWERSLRELIDAPAVTAGARPLAIELSLQSGNAGRQLVARLMRPGARGGWVNGSLSWGGLDSWSVREGQYRSDHLALARELHAVYRTRRQGGGYYYGYGEAGDRALDLGAFDSPQLWSLLDEAARIGMSLIHDVPELGEMGPCEHGELFVDVRRNGKRDSVATVVLRLDDGEAAADLEPLLFLGAGGHGLVGTERSDGAEAPNRRLRLVRLTRPAPAQLQRLFLSGSGLRSRGPSSTGSPPRSTRSCAMSPGCPRPTARSRRPRSPSPRSCCGRATAPGTPSSSLGVGITGSDRRPGRRRSGSARRPPVSAIAAPSRRSSPGPNSPEPALSVSVCSMPRRGPPKSRWPRSTGSRRCV